jgi:hypothetical protein
MLLKTGAKIDLWRRKCGRWWIYAPNSRLDSGAKIAFAISSNVMYWILQEKFMQLLNRAIFKVRISEKLNFCTALSRKKMHGSYFSCPRRFLIFL